MKERPILFSAPMVRAILEGRKSQTRRVVKPQPNPIRIGQDEVPSACGPCPYGVPGDRLWVRETWRICDHDFGMTDGEELPLAWLIRYQADDAAAWMNPPDRTQAAQRYGTANGSWVGAGRGDGLRPSIFMPRWASRITMEISEVRVQRLQEISEEDALAEGVREIGGNFAGCYEFCDRLSGTNAKDCFERGWDSINGKTHLWSSNPWVWALTFRKVA